MASSRITITELDNTINLNFDRLDDELTQLPPGASVRVVVPLCIGYAHKIDYLAHLIAGLKARHVTFTLYLNENPNDPEACNLWRKQNADLLAQEGLTVKDLKEWRQGARWISSEQRYNAYFDKAQDVRINTKAADEKPVTLLTLYSRDAVKYIGRKYRKEKKKRDDNNYSDLANNLIADIPKNVMDVLQSADTSEADINKFLDTLPDNMKTNCKEFYKKMKNSIQYIRTEVSDCLSWMETLDEDTGRVCILFYPWDIYESMKDAIKNSQQLGFRPGSLVHVKYDVKRLDNKKADSKRKSPPQTPASVEDLFVRTAGVIGMKDPSRGVDFLLEAAQKLGLFTNSEAQQTAPLNSTAKMSKRLRQPPSTNQLSASPPRQSTLSAAQDIPLQAPPLSALPTSSNSTIFMGRSPVDGGNAARIVTVSEFDQAQPSATPSGP